MIQSYKANIYFLRNIGNFVFSNERLLAIGRIGEPEDAEHDEEALHDGIRDAIIMGDLRTLYKDPRYGLIVAGEAALKSVIFGSW